MTGPRYSIIPGDFATDSRADVNHFRVLNLIGRHTNAHGWCRLKQANMADALGVTRETVNRKLADLVAWGYVEKRAIDATGRAIFYRTVMDRHPPPAVSSDDDHFLEVGPPVSGGSHVGCNSTGTCEEQITSGVSGAITPGVITGNHSKNDPSLTTQTPPNPPEGGSSADDETWKVKALSALRAEGRYRNGIEQFVAPLLNASHRFSLGKDRLSELRDIARRANALGSEPLRAAVKRLCEQSHKLTALRIVKEIETAERCGAMVVIKRGSIQWSRWHEHFREANPFAARMMDRPETSAWQVPAEWPPAKGNSDRGAA